MFLSTLWIPLSTERLLSVQATPDGISFVLFLLYWCLLIAFSLMCSTHCFWLYSDSEHSVHTSMMEAVALFQVSPEWHPALTAIQQHWEHINIVYASLGGYCQVFVLKDSSFQCFGCIRYSLFHLYVWSAILYNHRTEIGKLADPLYSNVVLRDIGNLSS